MSKKVLEKDLRTVDVTQVIADLDGEPIMAGPNLCSSCRGEVEEGKPMTVRKAVNMALLTPLRTDTDIKADEHVERRLLAQHVYEHDEVSFTSEHVTMIKKRAAALFGNPMIAGELCLIIDPAMRNKFKF